MGKVMASIRRCTSYRLIGPQGCSFATTSIEAPAIVTEVLTFFAYAHRNAQFIVIVADPFDASGGRVFDRLESRNIGKVISIIDVVKGSSALRRVGI